MIVRLLLTNLLYCLDGLVVVLYLVVTGMCLSKLQNEMLLAVAGCQMMVPF